MTTLNQVVQQLQARRRQTEHELEKLSLAIRALTSVGGTLEPTVRRKNRMSAKGRASIAKAQRERWAKLKSKTGPKTGKKKFKMSAAGRAAIAKAKKAWWAKKKAAQKK
jgi:hypothetical protein